MYIYIYNAYIYTEYAYTHVCVMGTNQTGFLDISCDRDLVPLS